MASSGAVSVGFATAAALSFGILRAYVSDEQAPPNAQSQEEQALALPRAGAVEEAPDNNSSSSSSSSSSSENLIGALSAQIMKHESEKAHMLTTLHQLYQNEADLKSALESEQMRAEEAALSTEAAHTAELNRLTSLVHVTQKELSAANKLLASNEKDLKDAAFEVAALKVSLESEEKMKDALSSDLALQTKELWEANETSTEALKRAREDAGIVEDASRALTRQMSKKHAEVIADLEESHAREIAMKTTLHATAAQSIRDAASRHAEQVATAHRSIVDELTREVGRLCAAAATTVGDNTATKEHALYQEVVLALSKTKAELRTSRST
jgi:chromosome segregation ATPase